jgi:predicted MFS family arabinose efflux permease
VLGAALTGLGYSLVYPGFGVEATRKAPPQSRAMAMGAYTSCLDLALGVGMPALGWMATRTGLPSVFLVSAILVISAMLIAAQLMRTQRGV